ncbi:hypothetical protein EV356DRAFT_316125 [Viridothelium virens]|uniref:Uncharacterized protein n=1 Tax=Viridothelium virens TaxID=1048519 RepID=A0A6A6GZN2_VIRVR|nr:hypothetical protein EV356DRAFT_316125 [Viridothelium virens]
MPDIRIHTPQLRCSFGQPSSVILLGLILLITEMMQLSLNVPQRTCGTVCGVADHHSCACWLYLLLDRVSDLCLCTLLIEAYWICGSAARRQRTWFVCTLDCSPQ